MQQQKRTTNDEDSERRPESSARSNDDSSSSWSLGLSMETLGRLKDGVKAIFIEPEPNPEENARNINRMVRKDTRQIGVQIERMRISEEKLIKKIRSAKRRNDRQEILLCLMQIKRLRQGKAQLTRQEFNVSSMAQNSSIMSSYGRSVQVANEQAKMMNAINRTNNPRNIQAVQHRHAREKMMFEMSRDFVDDMVKEIQEDASDEYETDEDQVQSLLMDPEMHSILESEGILPESVFAPSNPNHQQQYSMMEADLYMMNFGGNSGGGGGGIQYHEPRSVNQVRRLLSECPKVPNNHNNSNNTLNTNNNH